MGFLDKAKGAVRKAAEDHGDAVKGAAGKAGDFIDHKTGGKHTDKIATGRQKVEKALDHLNRKNDGPA